MTKAERALQTSPPPPWLKSLTSQARPRTRLAGVRLNEETPEALAEADRWIRDDAPEAIEGEGGDLQTYRVAAKLFDLGLERESVLERMLDWNDTKAIPPWEIDDLETKVNSAMTNRQRPIGVDNPGAPPAGMEDVQLPTDAEMMAKAPAAVQLKAIAEPPEPPGRGSWEILDIDVAAKLARRGRDPLLEGVLYAGEISVVYGAYGSRKTMAMMDVFFHIAAGLPWHGGIPTEQGGAVWVAAEGGSGVYPRLDALIAHYNLGRWVPMGVLERPVNMLSGPKDTLELIKSLRQKQERWGQPIRIVAIDTISAVAPGSDEGIADMGIVINHVRAIRQAMGKDLHLMLVHHPGKDASRGMRGTYALPADVDTTILVKKDSKTAGTVHLLKQRNGEDDRELLRFEAKVIELERDDRGRRVTGQVIVPRVTIGEAEIEARLAAGPKGGTSRSTIYRQKKRQREQAASETASETGETSETGKSLTQ